MKKQPKLGNCAICGRYCESTFEHFPPKAAFNDKPTRIYSMDNILEKMQDSKKIPSSFEGVHYDNKQKGHGDFLLCSRCNNMTGHLYAPAYIELNNAMLGLIVNNYEEYTLADKLVFKAKIKPLNFSKQALSMFCCSYPNIKEQYPIISELIMSKNKAINIEDCPFRLLMYLLTLDSIPGSTGPISLLMKDGRLDVKFEIDFPPFGFQLYDSGANNNAIDVTNFLTYKYDETAELVAQIPIFKKNTIFPVSTLKTP